MANKGKPKGSATLLEKLRDDSENGPLAALAELIVDDAFDRPLSDLVDAEQSAELLHKALSAWQQSDQAHAGIRDQWDRLVATLQSQTEPLGEALPTELRVGIDEWVAQPFAANRELLLALLDRPAFRQLVRELLVDTLVGFGKRLRTPVAGSRLGKGLSGLGRRARSRTGGIGDLAGDLASAVSDGVERQLESRAAEFADSAISSVIRELTDYLCDDSRADEQAALRQGLLTGLWELTGAQIAGEMERSNIEAGADVLRRSLGAWLDRPESRAELDGWLSTLLAHEDHDSLRELLDSLGLLDTFYELSVEQTRKRLQELVARKTFAQWLSTLED